MNTIVLEIKDVTKKYGKRTVIDHLSLCIQAGQIYGFLGPNGAGKTTTIKMIVGLISMDSGSIKINGMDITKHHEKAMQQVGAIVENPDLYDYLTGMENIKQFARLHHVNKDRILEVITLVGLEQRIQDKVSKYSLGMKQRLGLAVALLHKPKLLILDEPTNGLDPAGIKQLRELLKELAHKEKITVFVSSHLLSEVQLMCDQVAIIDKGKIIKTHTIDPSQNITNVYTLNVSDLEKSFSILKNRYTCNIQDNLLALEYTGNILDIVLELSSSNIQVFSFANKQDTLEQEFFKITGGIQ